MIEREGVRLRHELKFHISKKDYMMLRTKLRTVLGPDPHAKSDGKYHIRSLYFDDFRNTALFEKLAGVARRKKYRIRIYNHSDKVIKLERKTKLDQYISKESAKLSREEADRITKGDVSFLANSHDRLLRAFYLEHRRNYLRPNVIVDYHREAYVHPVGNVRITFDIDLHTALGSVSLFDPNVFTMGVVEGTGVILEVKYDNVLPKHIQGLLPSTIIPRAAIGKFVICKKFNQYNDWEDQ